MAEWWSYRPSDFILFAPEAYWHLFEQGNLSRWPLTLIGIVFSFALVAFVRLGSIQRGLVLACLAAAWSWLAWDFFAVRYAGINWAAPYMAAAFGLQTFGLLFIAASAGRREVCGSFAAPVLTAYAVFLHPLWPLLTGRSIEQAEIVGLAPDPTAIATLGVSLALRRGAILAVLPALWLVISAATLLAMNQIEGWVPAVALAVTAAATLSKMQDHRQSQDQVSKNARR